MSLLANLTLFLTRNYLAHQAISKEEMVLVIRQVRRPLAVTRLLSAKRTQACPTIEKRTRKGHHHWGWTISMAICSRHPLLQPVTTTVATLNDAPLLRRAYQRSLLKKEEILRSKLKIRVIHNKVSKSGHSIHANRYVVPSARTWSSLKTRIKMKVMKRSKLVLDCSQLKNARLSRVWSNMAVKVPLIQAPALTLPKLTNLMLFPTQWLGKQLQTAGA